MLENAQPSSSSSPFPSWTQQLISLLPSFWQQNSEKVEASPCHLESWNGGPWISRAQHKFWLWHPGAGGMRASSIGQSSAMIHLSCAILNHKQFLWQFKNKNEKLENKIPALSCLQPTSASFLGIKAVLTKANMTFQNPYQLQTPSPSDCSPDSFSSSYDDHTAQGLCFC